MSRTARDRRENTPPPVEKIELSARHTSVRLALALLIFAVGVSLIAFSLNRALTPEAGWTEIEAESSAELNCAGDFTFLYPLGAAGSPAAERRALTTLYTDACVTAYRLFTNDVEIEGVPNVRYLNAHPNEIVEIDPALYAAFAQVQNSGDRSLYLAPVYAAYDGIFYCTDPAQTADFDPRQNPELRAWFAQVCAFAKDPAQVNLELLGGNRVRLYVSDAYLAFARAEGIDSFIDFYWMKNAFIADYLAGRLTSAGYAMGTLSSRDGFLRNLDATGSADYALDILDRQGPDVRLAATLHYRGARAIVCLREYPLSAADAGNYAALPDGSFATRFLDAGDGLCKSALPNLTAYSETSGCAEILLQLIPIYVADEFDPAALPRLAAGGVHSVYCAGGEIRHTEEDIALTDVAEGCAVAP